MEEKTITLDNLPTPQEATCFDMIRTDDLSEEQIVELFKALADKGWTWENLNSVSIDDGHYCKGSYINLGWDRLHYLYTTEESFKHLYTNATGFHLHCLVTKQQTQSHSKCPLCGFSGDDLVFDFYCSNKGCRNYRP